MKTVYREKHSQGNPFLNKLADLCFTLLLKKIELKSLFLETFKFTFKFNFIPLKKSLCPFFNERFYVCYINPLNANPTKWSKTLKQFVGNLPTTCLSLFDHFVILVLYRVNNGCLFSAPTLKLEWEEE